MKHSQKILFMIIGIELIVGSIYFVYGSKGIKEIKALRHENETIQAQITKLNLDNMALEAQINDWQQLDWYKEQVAREELQFAKPDEEIFLY